MLTWFAGSRSMQLRCIPIISILLKVIAEGFVQEDSFTCYLELQKCFGIAVYLIKPDASLVKTTRTQQSQV